MIVNFVEMRRAEAPTLWVCLIGWTFESLAENFWPYAIIGDHVCGAQPRFEGMIRECDLPPIWNRIEKFIKFWILDCFHSDSKGHRCRLCDVVGYVSLLANKMYLFIYDERATKMLILFSSSQALC